MLTNAFDTIYDLLSNAIFGGDPSVAVYGQFFCEGIAIVCCAALVLLPFVIVWRIIRRFI